MDITALTIEGAYVITPRQFPDDRGVFLESFRGDRLAERLESENRALRREVAALAAKLDRVAAASELTARVLDRVTSNGNAMRTEEA